jgi:hypothetical protein
MAEHEDATLEVAGSVPAVRSIRSQRRANTPVSAAPDTPGQLIW